QPGAFEINGVNEQLDEAGQSKVALKGGGNIVIEHTAALTAIDVNSGGQRKSDANLNAAREIARQLRLRRIGGNIVVDFIDLANQGERSALMSELDEAFADDPAAVRIVPPGPFGLVQISRQRLGQSLDERLGRPCPICTGSGRTASLRSATERLLGELAERQESVAETVRVAVDLYAYLASDAAEPFKTFVDRHALPTPLLTPDESLPPAAYRLTA
ncbi:MAG: ribonuclease E/G, partial [Pseudomonadota bacterium]